MEELHQRVKNILAAHTPEEIAARADSNKELAKQIQAGVSTPCKRVTLVNQIHHENCVDDPVSINASTWYEVQSDEQPYTRRIKATEEGASLDLGWLNGESSCVVIENKTKLATGRTLTAEEKAVLDQMVLIVSYAGTAVAYVRPGRMMQLEFVDPKLVTYRSQSGDLNITVSAMPK